MLNKGEKNEVVKVLRRVEAEKYSEIYSIAKEIAKQKKKEIKKEKEIVDFMKEYTSLKRAEETAKEKAEKLRSLKGRKLEKKYKVTLCFNNYNTSEEVTVSADTSFLENEMREKLKTKVDNMVLKIICADCDKNAMNIINELKNFKF